MADKGFKERGKDVLYLLSNKDLNPLHQVLPPLVFRLSKLTFHFLSISTVCFVTSADPDTGSGTLATCSKKKRRRDITEDVLDEETEIRISPSMNQDIEDSHNLRDPRFLKTNNPKILHLSNLQIPTILGNFHNDHNDNEVHSHLNPLLLGVHPDWLRHQHLLENFPLPSFDWWKFPVVWNWIKSLNVKPTMF